MNNDTFKQTQKKYYPRTKPFTVLDRTEGDSKMLKCVVKFSPTATANEEREFKGTVARDF
jgi:hypothetical protein